MFQLVSFTVTGPYTLRGPRWRTLPAGELAQLAGAEVDPGRGSGYVPRTEEPDPKLRYDVMLVVRLPRPEPFRAPECMPNGTPWWRRWARQIVPRHSGRECCWYHGGDWHQVSAAAIRLVDDAHRAGLADEDIAASTDVLAALDNMPRWQRDALESLLSPAVGIAPDGYGQYINGQHRAQALLDTGVRRTVVVRWD